MKTLGICIPTYKRPDFLKRCILSAIDSADGRPIRIFVADDSASDDNEAVLTELRKMYPFVFVERNVVNIGIDANIQQAVELCDCDYAWLIGEDDQFLPGAVAEMIELIQRQFNPFLFANYHYVSADREHVLGVALVDAVDGEYPVDQFVADSLWSVGFIGSCVINREAWGTTVGSEYDGTYYTHVGRILDILANQRFLWVSGRASVANRAQGDDTFTWKKDAFGVFLGFERMCKIAGARNPSLSPAIERAATNFRAKFAYFSLKTTFRLRSEGAFDLRQYRVYIAPSRTIETWRKTWLLSLALVPRQLAKALALVVVRLR